MTKSIAAVSVTRATKPLAFGFVLAAAFVAVMLVLVAGMRPAEAAFPGSNGKIVFWAARSIASGDPSTTDTEIFSMDPSNPIGTLTQLTVNDKQDFNPAWSADGLEIVFKSRREGNNEIYTMKPTPEGRTNRPVNLTRNPSAHDSDPNWSLGGARIAFTSRRGISGDFEIYNTAANGTEQNPLTENTANDLNPAWSPDVQNQKITFRSDRDGNGEIYVMDSDGTDQTRLTTSSAPAHENNPDWQPGL